MNTLSHTLLHPAHGLGRATADASIYALPPPTTPQAALAGAGLGLEA